MPHAGDEYRFSTRNLDEQRVLLKALQAYGRMPDAPELRQLPRAEVPVVERLITKAKRVLALHRQAREAKQTKGKEIVCPELEIN